MFWSVGGGAGAALAVAAIVALLSVPRPELPDAVPYPVVDDERSSAELEDARSVVVEIATTPLPADVRGVGERVRVCGLLEVSDPQSTYSLQRSKLQAAVLSLLQQGRGHELMKLRELQAYLLERALVAKWSNTPMSEEQMASLAELGANLPRHLESSRVWFAGDPYFEATLRALFVERWATLVGLANHALSPSANDWRLIHRFRVLRQLRSGADGDPRELLDALADVAKYSPSYPLDYASGIVFYRAGAFGDAVEAFGKHLANHPTSDWAVRAQNFRLEAARALLE